MEAVEKKLTEEVREEIKKVSAVAFLVNRLGDPLPSEAIQRTKDVRTHKGYDTDGYGYQFCVNRLNEVFGDQWGFSWEIVNDSKGISKNGTTMFDITVRVNIWVINLDRPRSCIGGHISRTYADALKGAITNGFKKTASFWGVGRHAYEGALDDDNDPWPEYSRENGLENGSPANISQTPQQAQMPKQPEPPKPPKNDGDGHPALPAENGKEAGLCRRIRAKLEMVCERDKKRIDTWLTEEHCTTLNGLGYLSVGQLEVILSNVDTAFEAWKAGK